MTKMEKVKKRLLTAVRSNQIVPLREQMEPHSRAEVSPPLYHPIPQTCNQQQLPTAMHLPCLHQNILGVNAKKNPKQQKHVSKPDNDSELFLGSYFDTKPWPQSLSKSRPIWKTLQTYHQTVEDQAEIPSAHKAAITPESPQANTTAEITKAMLSLPVLGPQESGKIETATILPSLKPDPVDTATDAPQFTPPDFGPQKNKKKTNRFPDLTLWDKYSYAKLNYRCPY